MQYALTFNIEQPKELWQKHALEKRFSLAHKVKNKLIEQAKQLIDLYENDPELKQALEDLKQQKIKKSEVNAVRKKLQKQLNLSEFGFTNLATKIGNEFHYKKAGLGSGVLQNLSADVWRATEKYLFSSGKKLHFKKYEQITSLRNKTNDYAPNLYWHEENGVIYAHIQYGKLRLDLKPIKKPYELFAFNNAKVKAVTIKRLNCFGNWRYYVQVLFEGQKMVKESKSVEGVVGLDLGPSKIAVVSDNVATKIDLISPELKQKFKKLEKRIVRLQRAVDRSRRATNTNNFNEDGTVKPRDQRQPWVWSKRYCRLTGEIAFLKNKMKEIRNINHNLLAREIMQFGSEFVVEDLNLQSWAARSKETKINENTGRYMSKKRFGKVIGLNAPGMILQKIEYKLDCLGGKLDRIDAKEMKASQYRLDIDDYVKAELSDRVFTVFGVEVDRDLYSAFVLQNRKNRDIMIKKWDNFIALANGAVSLSRSSDLTQNGCENKEVLHSPKIWGV
ncbi:MAG: transposase [candidate division WOR-3 bacterium]